MPASPSASSFGLDRVVAKDGDDRVNLLAQEGLVILGVHVGVLAAVRLHDRAAEILDLGDRALEGLAIPVVLSAADRDTNDLARQGRVGVRLLAASAAAAGGQAEARDDGQGQEGLGDSASSHVVTLSSYARSWCMAGRGRVP